MNYSFENEQDGAHFNMFDTQNEEDYDNRGVSFDENSLKEIKDSDVKEYNGDELDHTDDKSDIERVSSTSTHYKDNANVSYINQKWYNIKEPDDESLEQNASMKQNGLYHDDKEFDDQNIDVYIIGAEHHMDSENELKFDQTGDTTALPQIKNDTGNNEEVGYKYEYVEEHQDQFSSNTDRSSSSFWLRPFQCYC